MTLRNRLALWYGTVLFLSVLFIFSSFYFFEYRTAKNKSDLQEDLEELEGVVWYAIPTVVVALAGGWWLTRKALQPIAKLTKAVENIHDTNLHIRLDQTGNGDELDRLTYVFNEMISRLETSFQRIRDFSLHASHELKTPLTILHGQLERELESSHLTEDRKETISSQIEEVQRLAKIVDGLLLLTKADAGQIPLKSESVPLHQLVTDAFEDAQILARQNEVTVQLTHCDNAMISGDRDRLRQLLLNLTDNAIKYNHPKGNVEISLKTTPQHAVLVISNTGSGIPKDKAEKVFDRFYRCDEAHEHKTEGCGLGLSICLWIVKAHRGKIEIRSVPGDKTDAVVEIPLV